MLLIGIQGGAYNFLLFTFNNEISQRRDYMSSAIAEVHTLCLAAGMNHCLVKPFTLRALFNCLAPYERAAHEAV